MPDHSCEHLAIDAIRRGVERIRLESFDLLPARAPLLSMESRRRSEAATEPSLRYLLALSRAKNRTWLPLAGGMMAELTTTLAKQINPVALRAGSFGSAALDSATYPFWSNSFHRPKRSGHRDKPVTCVRCPVSMR